MEAHFYDGTAYRLATDVYVYDGTWRTVQELHVWDGSAWRQFYTAIALALDSATGNALGPSSWLFSWATSTTSPAGYTIEITDVGSGIPFEYVDASTGPSGVYGPISTDPLASYSAQLLTDLSVPVGSPIVFTPT